MTATVPAAKIYTDDEYLLREVEAETRSEFRDGEIVAITGGTPAHNKGSAAT